MLLGQRMLVHACSTDHPVCSGISDVTQLSRVSSGVSIVRTYTTPDTVVWQLHAVKLRLNIARTAHARPRLYGVR